MLADRYSSAGVVAGLFGGLVSLNQVKSQPPEGGQVVVVVAFTSPHGTLIRMVALARVSSRDPQIDDSSVRLTCTNGVGGREQQRDVVRGEPAGGAHDASGPLQINT